MSSTNQLQCLFCNHPNPSGASFCNNCGSPLHLQPCAKCGAIDKRDSKACYKCSEEFSLAAIPEIAARPGTNEIWAEPVTPESNFALTSTIRVDRQAPSVLNDVDITSDRTPLPESAALILGEFSQGFRPDSKEPLLREVGSVVLNTVVQNDYPALISGGLQQSHEPISKGRAATPTGPRRWWWVILLLAVSVTTLSVYLYKRQFAQVAENRVVNQPSQPIAGAAPIVTPLPVTDVKMEPSQDHHAVKECPEAVEVLGLCSTDTKKE